MTQDQINILVDWFNTEYVSGDKFEVQAAVEAMFTEVYGIQEPNAEYVQWWVDQINNGNIAAEDMVETSLGFVEAGTLAEGEDQAALQTASQTKLATVDPEATSGNTESYTLTAGTDTGSDYVGTDSADVFTAPIAQNSFAGGLSNTLSTADVLDGKGDVDTLNATVTNDFVGADGGTATNVRPTTENIEIAMFEAINSGFTTTTVDAGNMNGVQQFWSNNGQSLNITDVRTNSNETTIGWKDGDQDSSFNVRFDSQHITNSGTTSQGDPVTFWLADVDDLDEGGNGLSVLPYSAIRLNVDGEEVPLEIDFAALTTYQDLADAINEALEDTEYTGIEAQTLAAETTTATVAGTTYTGTLNPIQLTNSGPEDLDIAGYTTIQGEQDPRGAFTNDVMVGEVEDTSSLTQTDIVLDNVGRGSKAGNLTVGNTSDSTGFDSNSPGIQQFNIDVNRDSWINTLSSTNTDNTNDTSLEVVNVENIDNNGTLRIDGLNDVRVFDAAAMSNDVTLTATLTEDTTERYLNLQDTATDPTADNSEESYNDVVSNEFLYQGGAANDQITLSIDNNNLAEAGTANREDFELSVNGNNGNDQINLSVTDTTTGTLATSGGNWYNNHQINSNVTVDAGQGDDTITTAGAGDFVINAGQGHDTVYTDNAAAKQKWVLNATNTNITDLISNAAASVTGVNAFVNVNFMGYEVEAEIANSYNASNTATITDLHVNQAIKEAINSHDVLSKLLEVNDGPGRTLVVSSLIDGSKVANDLTIEMANKALTTSQTSAGLTAADLFDATSGAGLGGEYTLATDATTGNDTNNVSQATGTPVVVNSNYASNNTIDMGTGDDVLVLGTEASSNDTIVYTGYNNGDDTIVNFVDQDITTNANADILDFTAYLGGSESTAATTDIAIAAGSLSDDTAYELSFDDTDATVTAANITFDSLNESDVLSALNGTAAATDLDSLVSGINADTSAAAASPVDDEYVLILENANNAGEYKFFHLSSTDGASTDFTSAQLIGSADFGSSQDFEGGNIA